MTIPTQAQIDAVFESFNRAGSPGCVVAVQLDGKLVFEKGYGLANLEWSAPNSPETVFHVASLSKQVTAFAIQLLVDDGKIKLDDDVRKYIPELHDFGKRITIANLIHHTSGLRDQWDLVSLSGTRMADVITEADLLRLIYRQRNLNFEPGSRYAYNNTGYTLLGVVVQRVSGKSFREFCDERIFKPLGMSHTHFHDDYQEMVPNRASSYVPSDGGGFHAATLSFGNTGATGLFTTAGDFAKWVENLFRPAVGTSALIDRMLEPGKFTDGRTNHYASGLLTGTYKGLPVAEHLGADAGFRSGILVFPKNALAVICLSNLASTDAAGLNRAVADLFIPASSPAVHHPGEVRLSESELRRWVGLFQFEPGMVGRFEVERGKLTLRIGTDAPIEGNALGPSEFRFPELGRCTFSVRNGKVSCRLETGDIVDVGTSVEPAATQIDASEFVGTYYCDELQSFCEVRSDGRGLSAYLSKGDGELTPVARDEFMRGNRLIRFRRNRRGRITGLLISTPRSFDVEFKRWAQGSGQN